MCGVQPDERLSVISQYSFLPWQFMIPAAEPVGISTIYVLSLIFENGYVNMNIYKFFMFIVYWVTFSLIDIFDPHLYDVNIFELNIWFRYFSQIGNARC